MSECPLCKGLIVFFIWAVLYFIYSTNNVKGGSMKVMLRCAAILLLSLVISGCATGPYGYPAPYQVYPPVYVAPPPAVYYPAPVVPYYYYPFYPRYHYYPHHYPYRHHFH